MLCAQAAGEAFVVPNGLLHGVLNVGEALAVAVTGA
jgi:hypothetical protein